ncbi:hypothetical protein OC834_002099 [Tilletia horrida]|uniref:Uncharacterized protein n=1 Tax=Tilletia horrida TaxID=155126 RepID=A0AAN6G6C5_9BASI|nr:hypothetical protein OC842_006224 [Tilletia horrida]KAK0532508.1 hypothetical protein OC835_003306 [Tilletia horrida]KAK0533843.1 hypothetical protein OC834_002099 [Tilletia horrida]
MPGHHESADVHRQEPQARPAVKTDSSQARLALKADLPTPPLPDMHNQPESAHEKAKSRCNTTQRHSPPMRAPRQPWRNFRVKTFNGRPPGGWEHLYKKGKAKQSADAEPAKQETAKQDADADAEQKAGLQGRKRKREEDTEVDRAEAGEHDDSHNIS